MHVLLSLASISFVFDAFELISVISGMSLGTSFSAMNKARISP